MNDRQRILTVRKELDQKVCNERQKDGERKKQLKKTSFSVSIMHAGTRRRVDRWIYRMEIRFKLIYASSFFPAAGRLSGKAVNSRGNWSAARVRRARGCRRAGVSGDDDSDTGR